MPSFFFIMLGRPPVSPLFPYPPLFRSVSGLGALTMRPRSKACSATLAAPPRESRSEEHTSELQSHSFISYAVFFFYNARPPPGFSPLSLPAALPFCVGPGRVDDEAALEGVLRDARGVAARE